MLFLAIFFGFLFVPSIAFAWGPLTHVYFGSEIFSYASLVPGGVMALLRKYRQDFLYGNLMADMIIGKKYLPDDKSSHSWDVGLRLFEQAKEDPEKAFVYGYLSHLAADTVAHEKLTDDKWHMGHAWVEIKADSMIDKAYWLQSVMISKSVRKRNDSFLENSLNSFIFSFKTNKRIYRGIVFLSFLNKQRKRGIDKQYIQRLHDASMVSMIDILQNGKKASVLTKSPL